MTIARVDAWTKALPLSEPVGHRGQFYGDVPVAFIRIRTEDKRAGMGCVVPPLDVTDEALGELGKRLEAAAEQLVGADPLHRLELIARVEDEARTAVDLALFDLLGQHAALPLHTLWGTPARGLGASRAIAPMGTGATVKKAAELLEGGAQALRIEAFGDAEIDAQRLMRVREEVGNEVGLSLHATGTHADLHALCSEAGPVGLDYIVVDPVDPRRLARLSYGLPAPLAVRCNTTDDALRLSAAGVPLLYVGLQPLGGLQALRSVAAICQGTGAGMVLAAGPEPAISIAAATHFAMGEPTVRFTELDGHLLLKADPTGGCLRYEEGRVLPTERPGLGWAKPRPTA